MAVLNQQRHQDGGIADQRVDRRIDLLGVDKHLNHGAEPRAVDAEQFPAETDVEELVLVMNRNRLDRAAIGWAVTRVHSNSPASDASSSSSRDVSASTASATSG